VAAIFLIAILGTRGLRPEKTKSSDPFYIVLQNVRLCAFKDVESFYENFGKLPAVVLTVDVVHEPPGATHSLDD